MPWYQVEGTHTYTRRLKIEAPTPEGAGLIFTSIGYTKGAIPAVERVTEIIECPDCDGSGQWGMTRAGTPGLPLVCDRCQGKGRISR